MAVISAADAVKFITDDSHGKIFSVTFIKRTTNETRTMVCRYGVRSKAVGGERAYDFAEKGLVCVYDMHKKGYRSIPTDALLTIKINGEELNVVYN